MSKLQEQSGSVPADTRLPGRPSQVRAGQCSGWAGLTLSQPCRSESVHTEGSGDPGRILTLYQAEVFPNPEILTPLPAKRVVSPSASALLSRAGGWGLGLRVC